MTVQSDPGNTDKCPLALFWLASLSVAFLYVLTLVMLPPHVFWSPDEGGKFLQAVGLRYDQHMHFVLPYGGKQADLDLSFYPSGGVYPRPSPSGDTSFAWPFFFPVLSALTYRALGLWGIYVVPLACGILTAVLSGLIIYTIIPSLAWVGVLTVGICSPLWFYSVLFWEHSLAVAAGLGAVYASTHILSGHTRKPTVVGFFLASSCLLISILVRFDMLILAASFPVAFAVVFYRWNQPPRKNMGLALLLCAVLALGVCVAGVGLYLLSASGDLAFPSYLHVLQSAINRAANLSLKTALPFARHIQSVVINEPGHFGVAMPTIATSVVLLFVLLSLLVCWLLPRTRTVVVPLATVAVSIVSLTALLTPSRYRALHGILVGAPYCAFALAALPTRGSCMSRTRVFLVGLTSSYLLLLLLASFFVGAETGGPEWGTRYGLIIFPLLAILAIAGISSLLRANSSPRYRTAVLSVALLAFAIACQSSVRGIMEIQVTKRDLATFESKLRAISLPTVTDLWWMGAAMSPYFAEKELYTVISPLDVAKDWLPSCGRDVPRFVYMSYGKGPDASAPDSPIILLSHTVINDMSFRIYEVRRDRE